MPREGWRGWVHIRTRSIVHLWHWRTTCRCIICLYYSHGAKKFQKVCIGPTFLLSVPLLVLIWSYPEQGYNSATGHFAWLFQSPETVSHWTFVRHLHYQRSKYDQNIFSHILTSLAVSKVRAANIVWCPCSDCSRVTAPYKLPFYYYLYIINYKELWDWYWSVLNRPGLLAASANKMNDQVIPSVWIRLNSPTSITERQRIARGK